MAESTFADRVAAREAVVAIVGLGYVGLPLAIRYAEQGFRTLGYDVDADLIDSLHAGSSHIDDVPDTQLAAVAGSGSFLPTAEPAMLRAPTPSTSASPHRSTTTTNRTSPTCAPPRN